MKYKVFPNDVYGLLKPALSMCFRCLIASEELHTMMRQHLSPTNMFVLLKKQGTPTSEGFLHKDRFSVPTNGQQVMISLIPIATLSPAICHQNCICFGIPVYKDDENISEVEKPVRITGSPAWYQARTIMKGFKDVKIDGVSVSNLW